MASKNDVKFTDDHQITLEELQHLHQLGFKLVPLGVIETTDPDTGQKTANHFQNIKGGKEPLDTDQIYENPQYWIAVRSLEAEAWRFKDVATYFAETHNKDAEGRTLYLNGCDIDSEEAYKRTEPYLEALKQITYVVKTRKSYGVHFYWFSHTQNKPIKPSDVNKDGTFEIKTEKSTMTLPSSLHRQHRDFAYQAIGRTDRIDINDQLYDTLTKELFADLIIEEEESEGGGRISQQPIQINNLPSKRLSPNHIAELAPKVAEHWTKGYRNDYQLGIVGAMIKLGIVEDNCEAVLRAIGESANDSEEDIENTIKKMRVSYEKAKNADDITKELGGRQQITKVILAQEGEKDQKKVVKRVDEIFEILRSAEVIVYDKETGEEINAEYIANQAVEEDEYGLQSHEAYVSLDESRHHNISVVDEAHQIILQECIKLFKDQRNEHYALVNIRKGNDKVKKKLFALDTPEFQTWVIQTWKWYQKYRLYRVGVNAVMLPSGGAQKIVDELKANEAFDTNIMILDYRTGYPPQLKGGKNKVPDCFFVNLDNEKGEAYKITSDGKVTLVSDPPPIFISEAGVLPQDYADFNYEPDIFDQFFKLINVRLDPLKQEIVSEAEKKLLLKTYIISLLWPDKRIHRAILNVIGPWGSAKTGLLKSIRFVVAPNDFDPPALPDGDERARVHAIANAFLPYFDNLTSIDDATSDTFCRTSTGGAYLVRMLYTNNGVYIFRFTRSLGFTSLQQIAWKPDLLSRCLIIRLADITNYVGETEVMNKLEGIRPKLFGYILDTLAEVFKYYKDHGNKFKVDVPAGARLADYIALCEMISRKTGENPGAFIEAYKKNMEQQVDSLVEGDFVVETLLKYVSKRAAGNYPLIDDRFWFKGSRSQLYRDLSDLIEAEGGGNVEKLVRNKQWPANEKWLGRRLNQSEKTLKSKGVYIHELSREKITNVIQFGIEYKGEYPHPQQTTAIVKVVNESVKIDEQYSTHSTLSAIDNDIKNYVVNLSLAPKIGNQARNFGSERHNDINDIFQKSIQLVKEKQSKTRATALAQQAPPPASTDMTVVIPTPQTQQQQQQEQQTNDEWLTPPISEKGKSLLQKAFPYGAVAPDLEWKPDTATGKQHIYCAAFRDVVNEPKPLVVYHIEDFAYDSRPEATLIIKVLNELRRYGHCIFWGGTAEGSDLHMLYERCQELGIDCSDIIAKYEFEDDDEEVED